MIMIIMTIITTTIIIIIIIIIIVIIITIIIMITIVNEQPSHLIRSPHLLSSVNVILTNLHQVNVEMSSFS